MSSHIYFLGFGGTLMGSLAYALCGLQMIDGVEKDEPRSEGPRLAALKGADQVPFKIPQV